MPLPERVIQPVSVSRGTLSYSVPDELEGVTNGTLANIIRQLSSLSRHAEEMFGNLFTEAEVVAARSSSLQAKIDKLAIRVTQLDSTVEEGNTVRLINKLYPHNISFKLDQLVKVPDHNLGISYFQCHYKISNCEKHFVHRRRSISR